MQSISAKNDKEENSIRVLIIYGRIVAVSAIVLTYMFYKQ